MDDSKVIYKHNQSVAPIRPAEVDKLTELAAAENEPLYTIRGVFPFDFIPNVLTIYRNKVSVTKKTFIFVFNVTNIPMENINYVTVHASFPFAAIEISDRYFSEQPIIVSHLRRDEAQQAMKLIDGLRLAVSQNIDVTKIPKEKLIDDVLKIGVINA